MVIGTSDVILEAAAQVKGGADARLPVLPRLLRPELDPKGSMIRDGEVMML